MASDEFLRMCSSASRRVICIGCARRWFQMVLYHCDSAGERRQFFLGLSLCFVLRRKGVCAMRLVNAAVTGEIGPDPNVRLPDKSGVAAAARLRIVYSRRHRMGATLLTLLALGCACLVLACAVRCVSHD